MKSKEEIHVEMEHLQKLLPNTAEKAFTRGMIVSLEWVLQEEER
jgi:hypothetical protein